MGSTNKQGRKIALVLALFIAVNAIAPVLVSAGGLSSTRLRLNRMQANTNTSFRLIFTTSSAPGTVNTVKIDFTSAWATATGAVAATQTVSVASCPAETSTTALPGTLTAAGASNAVSISGVTALAASTAYCVDLTASNAVTNPNVGSYYMTITTQNGSTVNDTAKVNVPIVSNDTINVTATVPPSFTFALDNNSTSFGAPLAPGTKQTTTARTVTINTNAKSGWIAFLRDASAATPGLYSPSVNYAVSPTTPGTTRDVDAAPNTEQYVWGVTASTQTAGVGATTLVSAYDATGGVNEGSGVDNSYRQIASGSGTSQNAVLTLVAAATVSPITPAASDYSDNIQVIGAGNF